MDIKEPHVSRAMVDYLEELVRPLPPKLGFDAERNAFDAGRYSIYEQLLAIRERSLAKK